MRIPIGWILLVGCVLRADGGLSAEKLGQDGAERASAVWGDWLEVCSVRSGRVNCRPSTLFFFSPDPGPSQWSLSGELGELRNDGFALDFRKSPWRFDECFEDAADTSRRTVVPGICRIEGGLLIRCYAKGWVERRASSDYATRPAGFVSGKQNAQFISILRRCDAQQELHRARAASGVARPPRDAASVSAWRIVCQVADETATCPTGQRVRIAAEAARERNLERDLREGETLAVCRGPLLSDGSAPWLDEVRRKDDSVQVRPGICKYEGEVLSWIVSRDWHDVQPVSDAHHKRPKSFLTTKAGGQILRVLYPGATKPDSERDGGR